MLPKLGKNEQLSKNLEWVDEKSFTQKAEFPSPEKRGMHNDIIGVSVSGNFGDHNQEFAFITRDMARSKSTPDWFKDHFIPEGAIVSKIAIRYSRHDSGLGGIQFFGKNNSLLLNVGTMKNPLYTTNNWYPYKTFNLKSGQ